MLPMKTKLLLYLLGSLLPFFLPGEAVGQAKYFTRSGTISFFSSTPLEDIKAENRQVASVLDLDKGELAFSVLMKSFSFPKALMQEHFNENYVESTKYPKSTFTGTIQHREAISPAQEGKYPVTVAGDLTLHGVTRPIKADGTIEVREGKVYAQSAFDLAPEDFNIRIPALVRDKIAKTIRVRVDVAYEPYLK